MNQITQEVSYVSVKKFRRARKGGKLVHRAISVSKMKKELDSLFSRFIRAKYGSQCYTCGKQGNMQCGHFVSRLYLSTRWDENNARPQCPGCNLFGRGKPLDFEEHLIKDIGLEKVQELKARRHELLKPNRIWYEEQIKKHKEMLASLAT